MKKYEYKVVGKTLKASGFDSQINEYLNELGQAGWEVFHIHENGWEFFEMLVTFYAKREIAIDNL